jgi:hypothetical protein
MIGAVLLFLAGASGPLIAYVATATLFQHHAEREPIENKARRRRKLTRLELIAEAHRAAPRWPTNGRGRPGRYKQRRRYMRHKWKRPHQLRRQGRTIRREFRAWDRR